MQPKMGYQPETHVTLLVDLDDLEKLKSHLSHCLNSYCLSREVSDLCTQVERKLADGMENPGSLFTAEFWKDVQDGLFNVRNTFLKIPRQIREHEELKNDAGTFEKKSEDVIGWVKSRLREPRGDKGIEIARDAHRSVGEMQLQAQTIIQWSKDETDTLLDRMGRIIIEIRQWIRVTDDRARKPSEHLVGIETKLKEGLGEDIQTSQRRIVTEEPSPSKETRAKTGGYPGKL